MENITNNKPKKFNYFIGIDVSKNELDYAIIHDNKLLFHREAINDPDEIKAFVKELKTLPKFTIAKSVFCMEHTGMYCNHLLNTLKKLRANIVVENAMQIKNAHGLIRGKYDKIDAIRIAQYAEKYRNELRLWTPRRPILIQLASLYSLRNKMLNMQMGIRIPIKEQADFFQKEVQKQSVNLCLDTIVSMKSDIKKIDSAIDDLLKSDEYLNRIFTLIISVPNVGRVTALEIIITTNEFKDIHSPKKFACYAGVAPFLKESGLYKGKAKVSKFANKKTKALLHICAVGALRYDKDLQDYYNRKVQIEGKHKMAAMNAVRNKLILRIFACVNQNRPFKKDYSLDKEIQQIN